MSELRTQVTTAGRKKRSAMSIVPRLFIILFSLAILLFGAAGRLNWYQAWAFVLLFGGLLAFYGLWALRHDPEQLAERSKTGKNTKSWDIVILTVYTILLIVMLTVAGLDAGRFRWGPAVPVLQGLGWLGAAMAALLIFWTLSANTYLSRTVRIQNDRGHQVIDSGPYSHIRHPMYLGIVVLMLAIPLLLGSLYALIPGAMIGILFVIRTGLEDWTLQNELAGYKEYASRIRYRLLPHIW